MYCCWHLSLMRNENPVLLEDTTPNPGAEDCVTETMTPGGRPPISQTKVVLRISISTFILITTTRRAVCAMPSGTTVP